MQDNVPLGLGDQVVFNSEIATPRGYKLGCAVGTTYSLDFNTALSVPVSLALSGATNREEIERSPLGMFTAMQKLSERMFLFVERGNISAPAAKVPRLVAMLEPVMHEITPNPDCSFHPKVWILRYEPETGQGSARYRLIVMTRNLTRDQSWDASLVLDGVEAERPDDNGPLVALLDMLARDGEVAPNKAWEALREGLPNVRWDMPKGFEKVRFHLHDGQEGLSWLPVKSNKLAVVSPFIKAKALGRLGATTDDFRVLVTREDQLAVEGDKLPNIGEKKVLRSDATHDGQGQVAQPSGLHAKIYVAEENVGGKKPRTWVTIGSGNATNAGLNCARNVEFFASLRGLTDRIGGIDQVLGDTGIGGLAQEWSEVGEIAEVEEVADKVLRAAQQLVVRSELTLKWREVEGSWRATLVFENGLLELPDEVSLAAGLVTFKQENVVAVVGCEVDLKPGKIRLGDTTQFVRMLLTGPEGAEKQLVLKARSDGLPLGNRMDDIIADVLKDPASVLRFITLMLGEKSALFDEGSTARARSERRGAVGAVSSDEPMFEVLLKAWIADDPAVEQIEEVVEKLRQSGHEDRLSEELSHLLETMQTAGKVW